MNELKSVDTIQFKEIELLQKNRFYLDLKQVVCIKEIELEVTEIYLNGSKVINLNISYDELKKLIAPEKKTGKLKAYNTNK